MNIAIIDADLIGRNRHRFPNLACEKISGFYKEKGHDVILKTDYKNLNEFDKIFMSKVFTDTEFPKEILNYQNIEYGGTGFYFDKAPELPFEIEHSMPDYHLYDIWIDNKVKSGTKINEFKEYIDYSIGFLTRGCFRKCGFCVNQKYDHVFKHSPLEEFYDPNRKKICLLDDNFLGCPNWKSLLQQLIDINKPFKFKQGLDERLLTDEKCEILFNSKYDGTITFAFDKIQEYNLIKSKLELIRKYTDKIPAFYVLVGFESTDKQDIINMFERIELLRTYHCLPYIMRFQNKNETPWKNSPYKPVYTTVAAYCNIQSAFKKMTLREFALCRGNSGQKCIDLVEKVNPSYLDKRW